MNGMVIDRELSKRIARQKGASRGKSACWYNAVKNLLMVDSLAGGAYVEGFVVCPSGRVISHGWVEINGAIVDTTPTYFDSDEKLFYFPAKRYSKDEAVDLVGCQLPTIDIFTESTSMEALRRAEQHASTHCNVL